MAILTNEATMGTPNSEQSVVADTQNNQQALKESSTAMSSEALDKAEIQKYEESAVKATGIVVVQLEELLTEGFHAENPDPATTLELVKSRDRASIQALISPIYNNLVLIGKMVNLSAADSTSQSVQISAWKANPLAAQSEAIELPASLSLDELKKIVNDFVFQINEATAMGALASSFAENYKKQDGKLEKKVEIFGKIRESLEKNPNATAAEPLPANLAEQNLNMTDYAEIFDEQGLTDLLRDIYQVVNSPQFASLQA